jgi:kynurenine formamidase
LKALGVESPSVADMNDMEELNTTHGILFEAKVIVVEGLANLALLSKPKVTFIALPMKIIADYGAPVRAVAFEEY